MGVIDTTTHTVTCECGASETVSIAQYGSAYAAGNWQDGKPFSHFDVTWGAYNDLTGPQITAALCKTCGKTPKIDVA